MRSRSLLALLLPLSLALAAADCGGDARADVTPPAPKPKVATPTLTARAQGDVVWFVYGVSGTGGIDSLIVQTSGFYSTIRRYAAQGKVDSVSVPRPAQGDSVTEGVRVKAVKLGVSSAWSAVVSRTYREPVVVPVPTVDSLKASPSAFTVPPGGKQHLTVTVFMS